MYYYRQNLENGGTAYQASEFPCESTVLIEISEEEYIKCTEELFSSSDDEYSEENKDKRIEELEKENAALLYQLLTGDEYTDV